MDESVDRQSSSHITTPGVVRKNRNRHRHGGALAYLLQNEAFGAPATTTASTQMAAIGAMPGLPHFAPKAKRVVYMFQNGAPSHVDLFDYKPKLKEWQGKEIPPELLGNRRLSTIDTSGQKAKPVCCRRLRSFRSTGISGAWVSDFLPRIGEIADDLCFVKSMHTGARESRAGDHVFSSQAASSGSAEHGIVAHLWARQHE